MLPVLITRAGSSAVAAAASIGVSAWVNSSTPLTWTSSTLSIQDSGNSGSGAPPGGAGIVEQGVDRGFPLGQGRRQPRHPVGAAQIGRDRLHRPVSGQLGD